MSSLDEMIGSLQGLEIKRALAVKMLLHDFKTKDICALLDVSDAFVSKWKTIYENEGADGLRLHYQGGTGFLTEQQRQKIFFYLKRKTNYSLKGLREFIKHQYGVVYQSDQSYYNLLKEAGLRWHRTQAVNPKRNTGQVLVRREEIKKNLKNASEI